ncbi:MAG: thiamine phosphate synthase [Pyrinomonadaceae bacterium]
MNQSPLTYLITSGSTKSNNFTPLLRLTEAAVQAGISFIQIREKQLSAALLYKLTRAIMGIAKQSKTKVLLNDRLDVALAAGADGVHLPADSFAPGIVRQQAGPTFLIGVSTHSVSEVVAALAQGADLAVFGPVFSTPDKRQFGEPVGLPILAEAAQAARPMPLLALGGVDLINYRPCLNAGAAGIAGIRMFSEPDKLSDIVNAINR